MRAIPVTIIAFVLALRSPATAGTEELLLDRSPATTGALTVPQGDPWINFSTDQNFAERIAFPAQATVTGMDIYTLAFSPGAVFGRSATVRLWSGTAAAPTTLLMQFTEDISAVDTVGAVNQFQLRAHVDFTTPLVLTGGSTYWIGMSGTVFNLGQHGLAGNFPDDSRMAQFFGAAYQFQTAPNVGDMAFRLSGTVLPEPRSALALGCAGLGLAWSRRRV